MAIFMNSSILLSNETYMLIISFLKYTEAELWKNAYSGLDLDPIMPNIELIQTIFIHYNMLKFMFLDRLCFRYRARERETPHFVLQNMQL